MTEITFLSEEWVQRFKGEVQNNPSYKEAAKTWEGDMTLVVQADPQVGIEADLHLYMDLWHGDCRDMRLVSKEEGEKAQFVITGSYDRWKQVAKGELEPIKGMMQGKLKLKGDLPYIVRYVQAAKELVNCTAKIPARFPDE
ncbi:MAG: Fis family transcriptional regulator [Proteobacteria bacterium]|nr:Fis family transcriptional regulator [Pseudomonadota bacterium]NIS67461.1 Fis family transcriptional regulator [Pseudomonadota bacterium]